MRTQSSALEKATLNLHLASKAFTILASLLGIKTTPKGFEPLRAEPNGFLVHHLNHSVTVSLSSKEEGIIMSRFSFASAGGLLEYMSAMGFEPMRSCLQWILSPPP